MASPAPPPRWLPIVGWVMIAVGVLSFFGDVTGRGAGLGDNLGGVGLAVDLLLDAFLVGGGILIVRSTRR